MRKMIAAVGGLVVVGAFAVAFAADDKEESLTIKQVMGTAHKNGLMKKVKAGDASQDEKVELLKLYLALYDNDPPKGDAHSWKEKTSEVVVQAAKVVVGGDPSALEVNCGGCHKVHKPS